MSELTVEHGSLDDLVRYCACGCGEPIPEESKREYLYGHKLRALGNVPDDPEPSTEAVAKATVRVTAKIRKEMQDSLEAYLLMGAGVWEMSDPYCAPVLTERATLIAEKLTPILARNQAFVRFFRSSSGFKEGMDLFQVLWPLAKIIGQHHLFHSVGDKNDGMPQVNYNAYVAPE